MRVRTQESREQTSSSSSLLLVLSFTLEWDDEDAGARVAPSHVHHVLFITNSARSRSPHSSMSFSSFSASVRSSSTSRSTSCGDSCGSRRTTLTVSQTTSGRPRLALALAFQHNLRLDIDVSQFPSDPSTPPEPKFSTEFTARSEFLFSPFLSYHRHLAQRQLRRTDEQQRCTVAAVRLLHSTIFRSTTSAGDHQYRRRRRPLQRVPRSIHAPARYEIRACIDAKLISFDVCGGADGLTSPTSQKMKRWTCPSSSPSLATDSLSEESAVERESESEKQRERGRVRAREWKKGKEKVLRERIEREGAITIVRFNLFVHSFGTNRVLAIIKQTTPARASSHRRRSSTTHPNVASSISSRTSR